MPRCGEAYVQSLEQNIVQHQLLEWLHKVHRISLSHEKKVEELNAINQEGRDYMIHVEKACRKIKSCHIPYSPEASIWIWRAQILLNHPLAQGTNLEYRKSEKSS